MDDAFAPFAERFSDAFSAWIESKHHTASATLRKLLFESYGLSSGLGALQLVYLMTDGSLSNAFAAAVFRHLDNLASNSSMRSGARTSMSRPAPSTSMWKSPCARPSTATKPWPA